MANVIKIKNSGTTSAVPTSLEHGELAINYSDGKIFYKNNSNTIVELATGGAGSVALDDLTDVVITTPIEGQIISFDGTNWINIDNFAEATKHLVKNDSGNTLIAGTVVYTYGANGTNILVREAQANSESQSATTVGLLATTLAPNDIGYVITSGLLAGIDTSLATAGDPVWLSPNSPGGVVYGLANKPSAPNHLVYLGTVTRSNENNGEIFVHILNGWELEELHNVAISSPESGQILVYNGTNWVNDAPFSPAAIESDILNTQQDVIALQNDVSKLYISAFMEVT